MEGLATERDRVRGFRALFEDDHVFRSWYEMALPRVYGYLYDHCGGVTTLAEELTQETFLEAVRNRFRFDGRADPITWVTSIARHKLADHYRKRQRDERRHLRLVLGETSMPASDPASAALDREAVLGALRRLPASQQVVLTLHYLDELPIVEIAPQLGKSESAVESLLARGRDNFKRALVTEEADDD